MSNAPFNVVKNADLYQFNHSTCLFFRVAVVMTREEAEKKWDTMSEKLVKHLVRAVSETANKKRQPNKRKQLAEDEDEENGKDETKEEEKTEKSEDEKDEEEEEEMETNEDDKLSMLVGILPILFYCILR